jgi:hypothetical protein
VDALNKSKFVGSNSDCQSIAYTGVSMQVKLRDKGVPSFFARVPPLIAEGIRQTGDHSPR